MALLTMEEEAHRAEFKTNEPFICKPHPFLPLLFLPDHCDIKVVDIDSRSVIKTITGHDTPVFRAFIDPTGRFLLSSSRDGSTMLWDAGLGQLLKTFKLLRFTMNSRATFHFSKPLIAYVHKCKNVALLDIESESILKILAGHCGYVCEIVSHPLEDLLASCSKDGTVRIWSWSERKEKNVLLGHSAGVSSLACSTTYLASSSWDKTVRLWRWSSGECARVFRFPKEFRPQSLVWKGPSLFALNGGTLYVIDTSGEDVGDWSLKKFKKLNEKTFGFEVVGDDTLVTSKWTGVFENGIVQVH